jgi:hypothetical protein
MEPFRMIIVYWPALGLLELEDFGSEFVIAGNRRRRALMNQLLI